MKNSCSKIITVNNFSFQGYYDGTCKEREAIGRAYDLLEKYKDNLVGFVGPACSNDLQVIEKLFTIQVHMDNRDIKMKTRIEIHTFINELEYHILSCKVRVHQ